MNPIAPLLFLLQAGSAAPPADLDEVARVASVMVDGDVCRRIQTPRSLEYLLKEDPRDRWLGSDNFDVNHEAFIQTKKTLMRLARLCAQPCDVNLWMPLPTKPPRIQILIRNVREMSQFWSWGVMHQETPPEMRRVLETGERVAVRRRPGMLSVLAPVRDSLGDVVGLVEVVAQAAPDPRENVK
jgi:hypothetical protein